MQADPGRGRARAGRGGQGAFAARLRRAAVAPLALFLSGCGSRFVVLRPAGPVAQRELHLMVLAGVAMAAVIVLVFVLVGIVAIRFRDHKGRRAPYRPDWHGSRVLELACFGIPVLILTVIAIPTIRGTYAMARVPRGGAPLVIDVTSLSWKWLFEYPAQHVATVNYLEMPTGKPVLFELTADSAMNTFWVPQLGGMEYTMPGEVLPLWLEAARPGVYMGHSANFSGLDFESMFFTVHAVAPAEFTAWAAAAARSDPALTAAGYRRLTAFGTTGTASYGSYPAQTFPAFTHGFSLTGDQYTKTDGGYQSMHMTPA